MKMYTQSANENAQIFLTPVKKKIRQFLKELFQLLTVNTTFRCGGPRITGPAREGPHGGPEGGHGSPGMNCDEMLCNIITKISPKALQNLLNFRFNVFRCVFLPANNLNKLRRYDNC